MDANASQQLTREQLLEYIKKQKGMIKKLQDQISSNASSSRNVSSSVSDTTSNDTTSNVTTDEANADNMMNSLKSDLAARTNELDVAKTKISKFTVLVKTKMKEIESLKKQLIDSSSSGSSSGTTGLTNVAKTTGDHSIDTSNSEDFSLEAMESFGMSLVKDFSSIFTTASSTSSDANKLTDSNVNETDSNVNELKEQLIQSSKEVDRLKTELLQCSQTIQHLNEQHNAVIARTKNEMSELHSHYTKQLDDVRTQLLDANKVNDELASKVESTQLESKAKASELMKEFDVVKSRLVEEEQQRTEGLESSIRQLTQDLEETRKALSDKESSDSKEVALLKSELLQLKTSLEEKHHQIIALEANASAADSLASKDLAQAKSVITDLHASLKNEEQSKTTLNEELKSIQMENDKLSKSLLAAQEKVETALKEVQEKEDLLKQVANSSSSSRSDSNKSSPQVQDTSSSSSDKSKKKKKKGGSASGDSNTASKQGEAAAAVGDISSKVEELKPTADSLLTSLEIEKTNNIVLKKENEQLLQAIESSCAENIKNQEKSKKLEDELNERLVDLQSIQTRVQVADKEIETLNKELTSSQQQLNGTKGLSKEIDELTTDKLALLTLKESLELKVASLSEELTCSSLQSVAHTKTIEGGQLEIKALKQKVLVLEEELRQEEGKLMDTIEDQKRREEQLLLQFSNQHDNERSHEEKLSSLQDSVEKLRVEKVEYENSVVELKGMLSVLEEQSRQYIDEKSRLEKSHEEAEAKLKIAMKKLKGSEEDAAQAREDREQFRRQLLHFEGLLEEEKDKARDLDDKYTNDLSVLTGTIQENDNLVKGLQASLADRESSIKTLRTQIVDLEASIDTFKELVSTLESPGAEKVEDSSASDELAAANERITSLVSQLESAKESMEKQLNAERAESEASIKALTEKVQRLKVLLTKTKNAAEEREAEFLKLSKLTTRYKRFGVQASLTISVYEGAKEKEKWCFVYEDGGPGVKRNTDGGMKWVKATAVNQWIAEGSTMIGSWPENLEDSWQQELSLVKQRSDGDRQALQAQLDETNRSFQAYKVRAADALKRLGSEERSERQRAQQVENSQLDSLNETIAKLEKQCGELEQLLQIEAEKAKEKDSELEQMTLGASSSAHLLAQEKENSNKLKLQFEETISSLEKDVSRLQALERDRERSEEKVEAISTPVTLIAIQQGDDSKINEDCEKEVVVDTETSFEEKMIDTIEKKMSPDDTKGSNSDVHRSQPDLQEYNAKLGNRKHMLYQKAGNEVNEALIVLRQENAKLLMEILEFKRMLALSDEQVTFLKGAVRDLECSLLREKEFNAEHRRINAEYLVNILRSFLMSNTAAEKAKLVGVICSLVHLSAEETKEINLRWSIKKNGPLAWFRAAPPNPKSIDITDVANDRL